MKKRHIRLAKRLCEEHQHEMNRKSSSSRPVWTEWPDVHVEYKRLFYRLAMKKEKDKRNVEM